MDLMKAIRELHLEKERLDRVIASLEELQQTGLDADALPVAKRRGRKAMDAAARREVSERMRRYWAARRSGKNATS